MEWNFLFFLNSIMLGVGLAMDAFSVSLADGLNEPNMQNKKMLSIASIFAIFQGVMPLIGWICVHTVVQYFQSFEKFIPWIALALLLYIGIKMIIDGTKNNDTCEEKMKLGLKAIIVQAIATSIDALSVGFTIAEYEVLMAIVCVLIIALVTFPICFGGLFIGKKFGASISTKAEIFGGIILIAIGIEIFLTSIL